VSKFGLLDPESDPANESSQRSISDRLADFPPVRQHHVIDIVQVDAAAAPHGFVSREAISSELNPPFRGRRRRAIPPEPTRHLAIRLTSKQYDRFVAYADRQQLTYQDALVRLMGHASEYSSKE